VLPGSPENLSQLFSINVAVCVPSGGGGAGGREQGPGELP
jgi:hypothetical protein